MVQHETVETAEQRELDEYPRSAFGIGNPGETVAAGQGLYYLLTGIWPLVSIRTFMMITGPKTDTWLVKTVGVLAAVIGSVLGSAAWTRRITREVHLLGIASAIGFTAIDVTYVLKRRISPVYLLDAAAEALAVAGWVLAWLRMRGMR